MASPVRPHPVPLLLLLLLLLTACAGAPRASAGARTQAPRGPVPPVAVVRLSAADAAVLAGQPLVAVERLEAGGAQVDVNVGPEDLERTLGSAAVLSADAVRSDTLLPRPTGRLARAPAAAGGPLRDATDVLASALVWQLMDARSASEDSLGCGTPAACAGAPLVLRTRIATYHLSLWPGAGIVLQSLHGSATLHAPDGRAVWADNCSVAGPLSPPDEGADAARYQALLDGAALRCARELYLKLQAQQARH